MTLPSNLNKHTYVGNGVTTAWPYMFKIFSNNGSEIKLYLTNITTGAVAEITSNYSVNVNDKTVTYPAVGSPLTSDSKITLLRVVPLTQEIALVNGGAFFAQTIEGGLDKVTAITQQLSEQQSRALTIPIGSSATGETIINDVLQASSNAADSAAASLASSVIATNAADELRFELVGILKDRVLNKYAINITSTNFPVLLANRRSNKLINNEIIQLGDSHGWGQGGQNYDVGLSGAGFLSRHSPLSYPRGFFKIIEEHLNKKLDIDKEMVSFVSNNSADENDKGYLTNLRDASEDDSYHGNGCIKLVSGRLKTTTYPLKSQGDTLFYTPLARGNADYTVYGQNTFMHKFGNSLGILCPNTQNNFAPNDDYITITPTASDESGSFTRYKSNGGMYYGFVTATHDSQFFVTASPLPYWFKAGTMLYLPGYGIIKVMSIGNGSNFAEVVFRNADESLIASDLSPYFYPGCKLYFNNYAPNILSGKITYRMKSYARRMYLGMLRSPSSGKLEIFFTENSGINEPNIINPSVTTKSTYFEGQRSGYPLVYKIVNGVEILLTAPEIIISGGVIVIDTYSSTENDAVYIIDWGQKQKGLLQMGYGGANASAVNYLTYGTPALFLRGFYFDGNIVKNHSMGAHTTGAMLGMEGSIADPAEIATHIDDILQYCCYTPSLLLFQAPIVNEYIKQTPIETFKANIDLIIGKLNDHRGTPGAKNMDVLIFSTIGDQWQFYADGAVIKYEDYFAAIKEYCISKGYGYIDFHQWIKDMINTEVVDIDMVYDDNRHPSPFIHNLIGNELKKIIDAIM